jgi:hypothetical protein
MEKIGTSILSHKWLDNLNRRTDSAQRNMPVESHMTPLPSVILWAGSSHRLHPHRLDWNFLMQNLFVLFPIRKLQ